MLDWWIFTLANLWSVDQHLGTTDLKFKNIYLLIFRERDTDLSFHLFTHSLLFLESALTGDGSSKFGLSGCCPNHLSHPARAWEHWFKTLKGLKNKPFCKINHSSLCAQSVVFTKLSIHGQVMPFLITQCTGTVGNQPRLCWWTSKYISNCQNRKLNWRRVKCDVERRQF